MNLNAIALFMLLMSTTLLASPAAKPQSPLRRVFTTLPNDYLGISIFPANRPATAAEREAMITIDDAKNGYLEAKGNDHTDIFGGAQVALFKAKSGQPLIGVKVISNGDGTQNILFVEEHGTAWRDVTADVLPKITDAMVDARAQELVPSFKDKQMKLTDCASGTYAYVLPRRGRTIEVVIESDCYSGEDRIVLWRLPFDGTKFSLDSSL